MKILLVVEDNKITRRNLSMLLQMHNYHVDAVETGEDAYDLIKVNVYDGLITDLRLPGQINGIDVLKRQRARNHNGKMILITAFCSAEIGEQAQQLGALYLEKPLILKEVIRYFAEGWQS